MYVIVMLNIVGWGGGYSNEFDFVIKNELD